MENVKFAVIQILNHIDYNIVGEVFDTFEEADNKCRNLKRDQHPDFFVEHYSTAKDIVTMYHDKNGNLQKIT